jgi:hypothetical protein
MPLTNGIPHAQTVRVMRPESTATRDGALINLVPGREFRAEIIQEQPGTVTLHTEYGVVFTVPSDSVIFFDS